MAVENRDRPRGCAPLDIFSVLYHQANKTFQAQVLAWSEQEAVDVLWAEICGENRLFPEGTELCVERVDDLGSVEQVPYPEMMPDRPCVYAVVLLEERG